MKQPMPISLSTTDFPFLSPPKYDQLGNPLIDDFYDNIGTFEFWWNHGLISDSTYKSLNESCPYDSFLFPRNRCYQALEHAYAELGDINPYGIYDNPCNDLGTLSHNLKLPLVSKLAALFHFPQ
jgi:serine carboxypeptidase-like clade II